MNLKQLLTNSFRIWVPASESRDFDTMTKHASGWDPNKISIENNFLSPNAFKGEIQVMKNLTLQEEEEEEFLKNALSLEWKSGTGKRGSERMLLRPRLCFFTLLGLWILEKENLSVEFWRRGKWGGLEEWWIDGRRELGVGEGGCGWGYGRKWENICI